jgi:Na+-transporting NADH:ubiquinone oxidoreductase subunit NqrC
MKENRYWAVIFMFVLTAILSTILIGLARYTEPQVRANQQIAFETAVIRSIPSIQANTPAEIHSVFERDFVSTDSGAYLYQPSGSPGGYVLPFSGQGFWSIIRGVIGIGTDRKTILGIWFYEQAETPGLGARIVEPVFYEQFAGKILRADARPVAIKSMADAKEGDIAALSGATQTCVRLEKLLNDAIVQWQEKMAPGGQGQ